MNKSDLVAIVAKENDLSSAAATRVLDTVLDTITNTLKSGGEVRLVGFGNFTVTERKAREGRNLRTGAKIKIPASKAPKFTAGKGLKDAVAG